MTTYTLLLYRRSPGPDAAPPLADREALGRHRALQAETSSRGDLLAVARLAAPDAARTVTASGHEVTDGPFVEAKEWLVGFYLVECEDEAQAVARARQVCVDEHHAVEVRPVTWRWRG